jgi:hypothetical protein
MDPSLVSLERQRMIHYLTVHVTRMTPPQLLVSIRAAVEKFEAALGEVEADAARAPWRDGEWNIAQVVDHVAQTQLRAAEELRHLLAGRRPPGPPVYDALVSGAARRASWSELIDGLFGANAEFERVLADASEHPGVDSQTARSIPVVNRTLADGRIEPEIFEAELDWKGYAMVQRLHLLDHRTQVRRILRIFGDSAHVSTPVTSATVSVRRQGDEP